MEVGEERGLKCSGGWVKWPNSKHFLGGKKVLCFRRWNPKTLCSVALLALFEQGIARQFLIKITEYMVYTRSTNAKISITMTHRALYENKFPTV